MNDDSRGCYTMQFYLWVFWLVALPMFGLTLAGLILWMMGG